MSLPRPARVLFLLLAVLSVSCRREPSAIIVSCVGDSLTAQGYPRYLRAALGRRGIRARVVNHGRSGNTTREYLAYLKAAEGDLGKERPDFVLVGLGTNDARIDGDHTTAAEFERNFRAILAVLGKFRTRSGRRPEILLGAAPPIPAGTPYPFGPGSPARLAGEINPAIEALARSHDAGFVDNYALFMRSPELLPDVHPLPEGYAAMAENWARAVSDRLPGRDR